MMHSLYYEFRRIYCDFSYILTKIISLGEVVFPYFQIGRFEGGVLSELMGLLPQLQISSKIGIKIVLSCNLPLSSHFWSSFRYPYLRILILA